MQFSLQEIAGHLGRPYHGDGERPIRGVAPLEEAGPEEIAFAAGSRWERKLSDTRAGAVIVKSPPGVAELAYILADNPHLAFIEVVRLFHPERRRLDGISPLADVDPDAAVAEPTSVGPFVRVGAGASVGPRCVVAAGCVISDGASVGSDCVLHPNVVLYEGVTLGDRVVIHAGSVVGSDGFGYITHDGVNHKIPQVGSVRIGSDVEIGAGVCVDRGALGDTVIGDGVKIDNLVQVAHNVTIGEGAIVVAQVGISGSATIGKRCVLAGRSGLKEHVTIGDGAVVAAASIATRDVKPGAVVAGYPAVDIETWRRSQVILRNLPRHWPKILKLLKKAEEE